MKLENYIKLCTGKIKRTDFNDNKGFEVYGGNGIIGYSGKYEFEGPGIVIGRVGAYAGNIYYIKKNRKINLTDNAIFLSLVKNDINVRYLYYYFKKNSLSKYVIGSTQPLITQSIINTLVLESLTLKSQEEIADCLSSFDDKIENNEDTINSLENISSELYKRWFIDFEFPNEEGLPYKSNGGEFKESELGMIPIDWNYERLINKRICEIIKPRVDQFEGTKKYIATADVDESGLVGKYQEIEYSTKPSRAGMTPEENSIWFAKMKDSKKLIIINKNIEDYEDYIFSTGFQGLAIKEEYLLYLWCYIKFGEFNTIKDNLSNGTTMQAINQSNLSKIEYVFPAKEVIETFNKKVVSNFEMIKELKKENEILKKIRDELIEELIK